LAGLLWIAALCATYVALKGVGVAHTHTHVSLAFATKIASMVFYLPQIDAACRLATPIRPIAWQCQKVFQLNLCANTSRTFVVVFSAKSHENRSTI